MQNESEQLDAMPGVVLGEPDVRLNGASAPLVVDTHDEATHENPYTAGAIKTAADMLAIFEERVSRGGADLLLEMSMVAEILATRDDIPGLYDLMHASVVAAGWTITKEAFVDGLTSEVESRRANEAATQTDEDDEPPRLAAVDKVLQIAKQHTLYTDPSGEAYADCVVIGHNETLRVGGKQYKELLAGAYLHQTGRAVVPTTLDNAVHTIKALAKHGNGVTAPQVHEVYVRCGRHGQDIYIDLGTPDRQIVRATASGWDIISYDVCPCKFVRSSGAKELPTPVRGGSVDDLKKLIRFQTENDFLLAVAWLHATLKPEGPFPILAISGAHGASKTGSTRALRKLVDNHSPLDVVFPKKTENLMIAAKHQRVVGYDNVSFVSEDQSDALCRLATGGGLSKRALYTDDDEATIEVKRPVLLNGINELFVREDLADRMLSIELPRIPEKERKTEAAMEARFDRLAGGILGGLLDGVVAGLKHGPTLKLPTLPRMADFASWAAACSLATNNNPDAFLDAYTENQGEVLAGVLENNPVAGAIVAVMHDPNGPSKLTGSSSELKRHLEGLLVDDGKGNKVFLVDKTARGWPKAPNAFSSALARAKPLLGHNGIYVGGGRRSKKDRVRRHVLKLVTPKPKVP